MTIHGTAGEAQPAPQSSLRRRLRLVASLAALLWLGLVALGCGDGPMSQVEITFRPMVGDKAFACGQTYTGLGTSQSSFKPYDFRMLVHNVRLLSSDGSEVAVTLTNDGTWQKDGVALLDFEDATGECENTGTSETRLKLMGEIPEGTYKGLVFSLGVPFAQNHQDAFAAAAPLNTTAMYWSWALGYKFFRIDGKIPENNDEFFRFHVGSMGCQVDPNDSNKVTECSLPNRPEIKLTEFVPGQSAVVIDVAAILKDAALDKGLGDFKPGCQAEPGNDQCKSLFAPLGMTFESPDLSPEKQTAFSVASLP